MKHKVHGTKWLLFSIFILFSLNNYCPFHNNKHAVKNSKTKNKFHSKCNGAMQMGNEESNKKWGKERDTPEKKQTTVN